MEEFAFNHQLVKRIKDPNFSIDDLAYYNLSLLVGREDFKFCVTDTRETRCLLLEDYQLENTDSPDNLNQALFRLFEGHHVLMAGFWKSVKLAIKNQKFTMVPAPIFMSDNIENYLKMSTTIDPETDSFFYYKHTQSDVVSAFAAEEKIVSHIQSIYPTLSVQVLHQGSALIEGIQRHKDHSPDKEVFIHLDTNHFSIIVTQSGNFIYYNRFAHKSPKDIVKYTLATMQELDINKETAKLLVWGNTQASSVYFEELYRYVRNVSFGGKPAYLRFAYMFDEAQDYQYFDAYNIYACE